MDKKRILILPVSVGGGHLRVAQALKEAFLKKLGEDIEINIEDALAHVAWPLRFFYRNVYFFILAIGPFIFTGVAPIIGVRRTLPILRLGIGF